MIDKEIEELIVDVTTFEIPVKNKEVVKEAINALNNEQIDVSKDALINDEYKNIDDSLKKYLLVYFYWIHNKEKKQSNDFVPMRLLHQHLDIKPKDEKKIINNYTFTYPFPCPNCNETVNVKFCDLRHITPQETICSSCNHIISNVITSECTCNLCKEIISKLQYYYNNLPDKIRDLVDQKIKQVQQDEIDDISDERLKWYADKYSSDLTKTEREIISFKPKNIQEIKSILNYREKNIINSLKEKKIIIEKQKVKDKEALIQEILKCFHLSYDDRYSFNRSAFDEINLKDLKVQEVSFNEDVIEVFFDVCSFFNNSCISEESSRKVYHRWRDYSFSESVDVLEKEWELNPYFFNQEMIEFYPIYNPDHVKNLFNSKVEKNKYHFLIQKYRNCLIIPNVRLFDLIDLSVIETHYSSKELKYLRYCIVDYVFYTLEGKPIKVIELQRGQHHNTEEYIEKDKLKRSAIKRIGIPFEESF